MNQLTERIFVAIPSFNDDELLPTLRDLYEKASDPSRVHVGLAIQDDSKTFYKSVIKELPKISPNIRHLFKKVVSKTASKELGVGRGRAMAHSFYNEEEYVLQIDSHTMVTKYWDQLLIALLGKAKEESQNPKTILTAYAGNYFLDEKGERTTQFPEGLNIHYGFYYPLYKRYDKKNGLPIWDIVPFSRISNAPLKFVPAPKFNANFAFGDREFAHGLGLDPEFVFFEEEIIQSVNLLGAGWSLAFPNVKEAIVKHLYVPEGDLSSTRRRPAASYIPADQSGELEARLVKNYQSFLDDPNLESKRVAYEDYANVNLKHGRLNPDTAFPKSWTLPLGTSSSGEVVDEGCGCKSGEEGHTHSAPDAGTSPVEEVVTTKKEARPWDMLNPNIGRVSVEVKASRLKACESCEFFTKTRQCSKCLCFMDLKTQLPHAECPVGKWGTAEAAPTSTES